MKKNKQKLAAFRQTLPETWKMCSNQTLITSPVVNGFLVRHFAILPPSGHSPKMHALTYKCTQKRKRKWSSVRFYFKMYFHTVGDVEITADVNKRENIFFTQNCSHLQTNFQIWYNYDAFTAITNRKYVQLTGIMTSVFKKASRDRRDLAERWYFSANILVLVTFSNTNHREISATSYTDKKTIKNYIFLTK